MCWFRMPVGPGQMNGPKDVPRHVLLYVEVTVRVQQVLEVLVHRGVQLAGVLEHTQNRGRVSRSIVRFLLRTNPRALLRPSPDE